MSTKAHAKVIRVDPSEALKIAGVTDFIDHNDIPGLKLFGTGQRVEEFFASQEVS